MTRQEAIKILKAIRVYECYPKSASEETKKAIDMAIEALSRDRPTGEWINREKCQVDEDAYEVATCSECGAEITIEYPHDNYCPSCGATMKAGDK